MTPSKNSGEPSSTGTRALGAVLPNTRVSALAIDPMTPTSTLYAGTDSGVFQSTDSGASWTALNTGLSGYALTAVDALAIGPGTPSTLYAATYGGVYSIQQVLAAKVVGTGTAASCTDAAFNAALAGGGVLTFTISNGITGTGTKTISADTTIDGGSLMTISGGNSVGVFWRRYRQPRHPHGH